MVENEQNTGAETKFEPVNVDISLEDLGKPAETETKLVEAPVIPLITETLSYKTGAGTTQLPLKNRQHVVNVRNMSYLSGKKYNFLVHCDTCGWEGRYEEEHIANNTAERHKLEYAR